MSPYQHQASERDLLQKMVEIYDGHTRRREQCESGASIENLKVQKEVD